MNAVHNLYIALKQRLDELLAMEIEGNQLEIEMRLDIENALALALSDLGPDIGYEAPQLKVGSRLLTREETLDMLSNGIDHPGCLSVPKIVEGLADYVRQHAPEGYTVVSDKFSTISVILDNVEIAHIIVDSEKVHLFHGANIDPMNVIAIQQMTKLFPVVFEFIDFMEQVDTMKNPDSQKEKSKRIKKEDKDPFEWI